MMRRQQQGHTTGAASLHEGALGTRSEQSELGARPGRKLTDMQEKTFPPKELLSTPLRRCQPTAALPGVR
jgi:hypothetical protein